MSRLRASLAVLAAVAVAVGVGYLLTDAPDADGTAPSPQDPTTEPSGQESEPGDDTDGSPVEALIAEGATGSVGVYGAPGEDAPKMRLDHPVRPGLPLVLLVAESRGEWLRVHLPVRPNGSTGWVRASEVKLSTTPYRLVIRLDEHRLELHEGGRSQWSIPVGIGTTATPTPGGLYFITELLEPPDPTGAYGPYAFGLSGFSDTLDSFAGGEGRLGLHGTNDPSTIGTDVSHGCIRLRNEDLLRLVGLLPLGTPVEIAA